MKKLLRTSLCAKRLLFIACFSLLGTNEALAQGGAFTIGSGSGVIGEEVTVPIYFTPSKTQQLQQVRVIVEYSSVLSYLHIGLDEESQRNGVTVAIEELGSQEGTDKPRMEILLKTGGETPFSAGPVGSIAFRISKDTRPHMVSLPVIEGSGIVAESKDEVTVQGNPGSIAIYEQSMVPQPLVSCFIFAH